ncbi:DUF3558 family protein [Streptoalloteichus hindustanus]|uniref:DUF3558 domain-containing protein n=1 Tax=Streptoalloteichus hindustanus TaxID=2017 RepID=A0A1M5NQ76_STRHI|nr:DUF3558 family protein [Streptoalloteichus hindustanus]SHG91711.1 Protein of unknown function [Streptoalloteichus hindustanus]
MPDRRLVVLLTTLALGAAVAGCGTAGSPSAKVPRSDAATASSAPAFPPRPKNIPVDNFDTCTTMSKAQVQQLGLDTGPSKGTRSADMFGNMGCDLSKGRGNPTTII